MRKEKHVRDQTSTGTHRSPEKEDRLWTTGVIDKANSLVTAVGRGSRQREHRVVTMTITHLPCQDYSCGSPSPHPQHVEGFSAEVEFSLRGCTLGDLRTCSWWLVVVRLCSGHVSDESGSWCLELEAGTESQHAWIFVLQEPCVEIACESCVSHNRLFLLLFGVQVEEVQDSLGRWTS